MVLVEKEIKNIYIAGATPVASAWIYHNATLWLISYSSDWSTRYTIADKDLWATALYWQWYLYQRWNNNSFTVNNWNNNISTTAINANNYWPWNYYNDNTYIANWTYYNNWDSSNNKNLWWWVTWTYEAMQWPCPNWFHVPSYSDISNMKTIITNFTWSTDINDCKQYIFWQPCSTIYNHMSQPYEKTNDYYWTWLSDWISSNNRMAYARLNNSSRINNTWSTNACVIRPFKNVSVMPDSDWTKLL